MWIVACQIRLSKKQFARPRQLVDANPSDSSATDTCEVGPGNSTFSLHPFTPDHLIFHISPLTPLYPFTPLPHDPSPLTASPCSLFQLRQFHIHHSSFPIPLHHLPLIPFTPYPLTPDPSRVPLRPSPLPPYPLIPSPPKPGESEVVYAATYRLMVSFLAWLRVCATSYASCIRRRWSMSGPNAFSMRRAISGDREALPARRSDRVARRTFRMVAALDTLKPRASMISVLIRSPG